MSRLNNLIGSSGGIKGDEILTKGPTEMGRRHFLKILAITTAAASASISCKDDPSHTDSHTNLPEPVYELKFGPYDNFDGQGAHQDYDGTELAVAGELSSQLWDHGPSSTVVDNPSGNLTVLNENFQFVKYGWEDRQIQEIVTYLVNNPRPVSRYERETLENLLNDRGKTVIADIEVKELEKQVLAIRYLFNNRRELFNEKGTKMTEIVSKQGIEILANDGFYKLVKKVLMNMNYSLLVNLCKKNNSMTA